MPTSHNGIEKNQEVESFFAVLTKLRAVKRSIHAWENEVLSELSFMTSDVRKQNFIQNFSQPGVDQAQMRKGITLFPTNKQGVIWMKMAELQVEKANYQNLLNAFQSELKNQIQVYY